MFKCKQCGYEGDYTAEPCANCGAEPVIDEQDVAITKRELEKALADRNIGKIFASRHLLADSGNAIAQREFAKLLERGEYQLRDIDAAMEYYRLAARQNEPYSAYRYAKLVDRTSEVASNFWLKYAAVLGSINSYPDASALFSLEGREDVAAYYCSLAAECDDTDSITEMAKRWHEGIGVTQNLAYAKWYLDKMAIPPITYIKLAYKLRGVRAEEPKKLTFPDYDRHLRQLAEAAKKYGFDSAYFNLTTMLAKQGDINAETALAILYLEGKGTEKDITRAKACLELAVSHGSAAAAIYLGSEYISGKNYGQNPTLALEYFTKAASLGYTDAYERMGDIYHDGELGERDIAKAIELYERAAAGGSENARKKADELKATRLDFYLEGYKIINSTSPVSHDDAFNAFRSFAIATAMGEARAPRYLAICYAHGFGTEKDRTAAFYWFREAYNRADPEAYLPLAKCYIDGFGTNRNYKKATAAIKAAMARGIKGAEAELNAIYRQKMNKLVRRLYSTAMRLIHQKKFCEAVKMLSSFEALCYPKAIYTLGCLYEFGRGAPKSDRAKADKYYELACRGSAFGSFTDPNSTYKLKILKMIR